MVSRVNSMVTWLVYLGIISFVGFVRPTKNDRKKGKKRAGPIDTGGPIIPHSPVMRHNKEKGKGGNF